MNEKKRNLRPLALFLSVVLLAVGVVGGTYAWLIDQTDTVENTFTYGDINIKLEETNTELDDDDNKNTNTYKMMPGIDLAKDPVITVADGSEHCWLFVELEKTDNFDDYLEYHIADKWVQLEDQNGTAMDGIYYRFIDAEKDTEKAIPVLLGNSDHPNGIVTVKGSVTKEMLNALDKDGATDYPKLSVTGYAVQYVGFEAEVSEGASEATPEQVNAAALKAWNAVLDQNTTP